MQHKSTMAVEKKKNAFLLCKMSKNEQKVMRICTEMKGKKKY